MTLLRKPVIVLFGMMSRHPVAGMVWLTVQYLIGFRRLGYDVYAVLTGLLATDTEGST